MRFSKIIIAAIFSTIATSMSAQITYSNWRLNINNAPKHKFLDVLVDQWNGFYWTCKGTNFLEVNVSPANPRIAGTGDQIVFYNSVTNRYNNIKVANVYQQSDARSKTEIKALPNGLSTILGLRPVSYKWADNNLSMVRMQSNSENADSVTVAFGPESDTQIQFGFLAQDVEQVLPEVVATDETGNKMINYTAIIPLMVQAIQELQQTIEDQASTIEQLSMYIPVNRTLAHSSNKILSCSPNPTSGFVTIETEVINGSESEIVITSLSGNREKTFKVSSSVLSCDVSSLPTGIHIVSLYVEGQLHDTCRLIKQ